jgi:hypothetical protein
MTGLLVPSSACRYSAPPRPAALPVKYTWRMRGLHTAPAPAQLQNRPPPE